MKAGDMDYEGMRAVMGAIADTPVADPGPYRQQVRFDPIDLGRVLDLPTLVQALGS